MPNTPCHHPHTLPVQVEYIPAVLKDRLQWVGWHYALSAGKWTKIPINPSTGRKAKINDPGTWGTFVEALECCQRWGLDGIGFVFTSDDPYCGVDLDKCRDPGTGQIEPWADTIIRGLDSYAEVSPSGTGVKLFMRATLPPGGNRRSLTELYDRGRYFTLTGHHLPHTPRTLEDRQTQLAALHARIFGASAAAGPAAQPPPLSQTSRPAALIVFGHLNDDEVLSRAFQARNGLKFARLWRGDTTEYASPSEADMALCHLLAFWVGRDPARIDRLFRQSGLMRPKWDVRHFADGQTYGAVTIDKALKGLHTSYQGTLSEMSGGWPSRILVEVA